MSDHTTNALPDDLPALDLLRHSIAVFDDFLRSAPKGVLLAGIAEDILRDARWALAWANGEPTPIKPRLRRTPEVSLNEIFDELELLTTIVMRSRVGRNIWPQQAARRQAIDMLGVTPKLFKKITTPKKRRV